MKKILIFAAAAFAGTALLSSCGDKLAARHEVVLSDTTGTCLPFIRSFEEDDYASSAKKMLPGKKLIDSLSYLIGINFGFTSEYNFNGLDVDKVFEGVGDLQKAGLKDFDKAVRANFAGPDGEAIAGHFKMNPVLLREVAQKAENDGENRSEGIRDSLSYLLGINFGYQMASMKLDAATVESSMRIFIAVDTAKVFLKYAQTQFRDSTYQNEFAKNFRVAPDKLEAVAGRYYEAINNAKLENIKVQSKLFLKEVSKLSFINESAVPYKETVDTVEVTKTAPIYYHYTKLADADSPKVELGDSVMVKYTGRHIDYNTFDSGEFPIDGVQFDGNLVPGFIGAILLLREGDEVEVVMPYQLAYGEKGRRSWNGYGIYPYETLVFKISVSNLRMAAPKAEAEVAPEAAE